MTKPVTVSLQAVFEAVPSELEHAGLIDSPLDATAPGGAAAESAVTQTLATLPIGLAIFGPQRRLLLANPRFAALLALPTDCLASGFALDAMLNLMEGLEEFASPDGLAFVAALRGLEPGISRTSRRQRADGPLIEITFDSLPDGGCAISVSDITPQAHAEDEARRRARLLDLVLLNVPHGICVYGPATASRCSTTHILR
jgi:PAS domain-containing protein